MYLILMHFSYIKRKIILMHFFANLNLYFLQRIFLKYLYNQICIEFYHLPFYIYIYIFFFYFT